MRTITDKELIVLLRNGNQLGYELLFRKYYMRVLHFARGLTRNDWVSEDIAQNVFLKLWVMHESISGDSINNLLFTLAKNEVTDYFRSQKHVSKYLDYQQTFPETENGPEQELHRREMTELIDAGMEQLSERRREVFYMSRVLNLPQKEIAARLGISVRTVEKHLEIVLRQLKESLKEKNNG